MQFKVEWEASFDGCAMYGIAEEYAINGMIESSESFLVDQKGDMWYHPDKSLHPTRISSGYSVCKPLIKVNDEYLPIEEIERRLVEYEKLQEFMENL